MPFLWIITRFSLIALLWNTCVAHTAQYIGCYTDRGDRDLDGFNQIYKTQLTPEFCASICRQHGFTYSALQNADECHCDNSYGQYGQANESECNSPCTGNSSAKCGGDRRNSVYTVCPAGQYGADCLFDCPLLCGKKGSESCHYSTGECIYGCEKGYSHCNKTENNCFVLKAEKRKKLFNLNTQPGKWLNIFREVTFPQPGRINKVDYYAVESGEAFVSFWRKVPNTADVWAMVGKVVLTATGSGRNSTTVDEDILVSEGDALGIHYDTTKQPTRGIIPYDKASTKLSGIHSIGDLSNILYKDVRDDGWLRWHKEKLSVSKARGLPAIHITLDCMQHTCPNNKYGPNCTLDCLPNCIEKSCSPLNGECLKGCIKHWMGSHCSKKCPANCKDGDCDRFRGICLNGCEPGYIGNECFDKCSNNTYGNQCVNVCHCVNSSACDHVTGKCPITDSNNMCEEGWTGCNCSIKISSLQKINPMAAIITFLVMLILLCILICISAALLYKFKAWKSEGRYLVEGNVTATEMKPYSDHEAGAVAYEPFYGDEVQINGKQ